MKSLLIAILILLHQPIEVPYKQLTFADFKGKGEGAAYTVTEINLSEEHSAGRYKIFVNCYFLPEESWINLMTPYVLKHEQGHLDESELFTLWMRKYFEQFQGCDSLTYLVVKSYYNYMIDKWRHKQEEYDKETYNGQDTAMQTNWNRYFEYNLKFP